MSDIQNTDSLCAAFGIPQQYGSCHCAKVDGYAVEGHAPAYDIKKMLAEKPDAVGLSVPAMPVGSSGMEHRDYPHWGVEYNLPLIGKNGEVSSYTKHDPIH